MSNAIVKGDSGVLGVTSTAAAAAAAEGLSVFAGLTAALFFFAGVEISASVDNNLSVGFVSDLSGVLIIDNASMDA